MSGAAFTKEQLELAKQLQASYRASGSLTSQPSSSARRPQDGLCRPLPPRSTRASHGAPTASYSTSGRPPVRPVMQSQSEKRLPPPDRKPIVQSQPTPAHLVPKPAPPPSTVGKPSVGIRVAKPNGAAVGDIARPLQQTEKEKAKIENTHRVDKDAWKPVVTYYSEEPKSTTKSAHATKATRLTQLTQNTQAAQVRTENKPLAQGTNGRAKSETKPVPVMGVDRMQTADLIHFEETPMQALDNPGMFRPRAMSKNEELLSAAFTDVAMSGMKDVRARAAGPAVGPAAGAGSRADAKKMAAALKASQEVLEALQINKSGKAVTWNWSHEAPKPRNVPDEENEEPVTAPDDVFCRPWTRPWGPNNLPLTAPGLEKKAPATSSKPKSSAPLQSVGLKASRHRD